MISLSPNLIIESCDGGQIIVTQSMAGLSQITDQFVELIAKVEDETSVKVLDCFNLGDKYDLRLAKALVEIIHNPSLRSDRAPCF